MHSASLPVRMAVNVLIYHEMDFLRTKKKPCFMHTHTFGDICAIDNKIQSWMAFMWLSHEIPHAWFQFVSLTIDQWWDWKCKTVYQTDVHRNHKFWHTFDRICFIFSTLNFAIDDFANDKKNVIFSIDWFAIRICPAPHSSSVRFIFIPITICGQDTRIAFCRLKSKWKP